MKRLYLVCGEPSGDLHGAGLAQALSHCRLSGVAGPEMRKAGVEELFAMEAFQMMGFLLNPLKIFRQLDQVKRSILREQPDAVLFIDYPGFNLRLASSLRKAGFRGKLIHYICPSVWAWGKGRIKQMASSLDLLLTIFPFEKAYFEKSGLQVHYVGHPLVESIRPPDREESPGQPLLALFPGSRKKEILKHLPLQLEAAKRLREKIDFTLGISLSSAHRPLLKGLEGKIPYRLFASSSQLMSSCRAALAKSGTVTLELALHEVPSVAMYSVDPLHRWILRYLVRLKLPYYCIVNLLADRELFPEWMERSPTPERLAESLYPFFADEQARTACQAGCREVREALGKTSASREAALKIEALLQ